MYFQSGDERELKVDRMFKRSQGKKKILTAINYKERVFVLTSKTLSYYGGTTEKRGKLKGEVGLIHVKIVEEVDKGAFDKPYCFQIVYQEYTLYIIANSEDQRAGWIAAVQDECRKNRILLSFYHSGAFITGLWTCCKSPEKNKTGCKETFIAIEKKENYITDKPLPPLPQSPTPMQESTSREKIVVALYDFSGQEPEDLSFRKGDEFTIVKHEGDHWLYVTDRTRKTGFVPVSYVREKGGFFSENWFFGDMYRHVAEDLLINQDDDLITLPYTTQNVLAQIIFVHFKCKGQEGCFLVRNSSKDGLYTLSLLHCGQVKHYHIKQDANNFYNISKRHHFPSIPELIEYHKLNSGGLVTRLREPPMCHNNPPTVGLGHDKWEIDRSEIQLSSELGSGQFGRVCRGIWRNNIDVAVKMMKEGSMSEQDFVAEAKIMKLFNHPNLVQLYGVCSQKPFYIVTEYVPNGCLLNFLRNNRNNFLGKLSMLVEMITHVVSAMAYLERKNFIHRDLAARNCLVGFNNVVKVCDFGLSRFVLDDEYTASEGTKFPIKWAAPEVMNYSKFSSKSDIWAFGILMWEVFTCGSSPYPSLGNAQVVRFLMSGQRLEKPDNCPPEMYRIMSSCWLEDPNTRPTFVQIFRKIKELSGEDYADTCE